MERNRTAAVTTCLWFVACLCLPLLQNALHFVPDVHVNENRTLAKFPQPGLRASYGRELQDYITDHFGLRLHLTLIANRLAVALGESPSSRVVLGKNGWLYYAENLTGNSGELVPLVADAVARHEAYQAWLANRGIVNFVAMPTDKHNVYPEHVPDRAVRVETSDLHRHFRAYLREHHSPLNIVDIGDAMLAQKARGDLLYCKTDTHWNNLGALVGSTQITAAIARVFPAVPKHTMQDYEWKQVGVSGGDLAQMLSLPMIFPDVDYVVTPRFTARAKPVDPGFTMPENDPLCQPTAMQTGDPSLPKALFFRDSYLNRVSTPIGEDFSRAIYVWNMGRFPYDLVEREQPDLVVQERLERDFAHIAPIPEPVAAELAELDRWRRAFAASSSVVHHETAHGTPSVLHPRAPTDDERTKVAVVELVGTALVPTVLSIDSGDGHPQKRVLYPGAGLALVRLPAWPTELRVETRAGELDAAVPFEITLKAITPPPAPAPPPPPATPAHP